jgi:thiazole/oxazole-forming peptide maturase SagD family component
MINPLNQEDFYIPAQMFFLDYARSNKTNEKINYLPISTGTAAHTTYKNAFKNSLIEYLQIDSLMLFWYGNNISVPEVVLDDKVKFFLEKNNLFPEQHDIKVLDLTLDKPFPIFLIIIHGEEYPKFSFGIQGDNSAHNAFYRGFLESASIMNHLYGSFFNNYNEFISTFDMNHDFNDLDSNTTFWANDFRLREKNKFLKNKIKGKKNISNIESVNENELIPKIFEYIKKNDFNLGCFDITCPELGLKKWYVLRTIIPELLPMCIPKAFFQNHPRFSKTNGSEYVLPHPLP